MLHDLRLLNIENYFLTHTNSINHGDINRSEIIRYTPVSCHCVWSVYFQLILTAISNNNFRCLRSLLTTI
jgi:hypothetical protein